MKKKNSTPLKKKKRKREKLENKEGESKINKKKQKDSNSLSAVETPSSPVTIFTPSALQSSLPSPLHPSPSKRRPSQSPTPTLTPSPYFSTSLSSTLTTPSVSPSPPTTTPSPSLFQMSNEELLSLCGGCLARSHNPKGKLARIAEQEKQYLENKKKKV
jgi:hypothetical protein